MTDIASGTNSSMLYVMSTQVCIFDIFFLIEREGGVGAGRSGGSQFWLIEEPCMSFWRLRTEVHNQNEVADFSVIFIFFFFKVLHGVMLPANKF